MYKNSGYGSSYSEGMYAVESVADGDTFTLTNGNVVRLIDVDAPELGECYGDEARKALTKLILNREVELRKDVVATDKYKRLLRYVYLHDRNPKVDSLFVNEYMIKHGYARTYHLRNNDKHHISLTMLENSAQKNKRGLWGACDYKKDRIVNGNDEEFYTLKHKKGCVIKGNVSDRGNKKYFMPGCPNYTRVHVEEYKNEKWFCTESEAQKAGFVKSGGCK